MSQPTHWRSSVKQRQRTETCQWYVTCQLTRNTSQRMAPEWGFYYSHSTKTTLDADERWNQSSLSVVGRMLISSVGCMRRRIDDNESTIGRRFLRYHRWKLINHVCFCRFNLRVIFSSIVFLSQCFIENRTCRRCIFSGMKSSLFQTMDMLLG